MRTKAKDRTAPVLLNTREAASHLNIGIATLYERQKEHAVWQPDERRKRRCTYHVQHLRVLEGLILGNYSADDALEMWTAQKKQIGTMFVDTVHRRN